MDELNAEQQASLLDGPVPGESLTADPENPNAWETAPDYSELELFIDDLFMNITSEEQLDGIMDPIRKGVALEDVAQMLLFQAMSTGKINTDLMLTAIEPTLYMLIGLSEYAGVTNPTLYPEDSMGPEEDDEVSRLEAAADGGATKMEDLPAPDGVSKSLLEKLKGGPDVN